ncbi:MAG TPA: hypothetical protein VG826_01890 [Pirellulales bacterium]|nr:hypothetical protein [Pirellulales bacterium]
MTRPQPFRYLQERVHKEIEAFSQHSLFGEQSSEGTARGTKVPPDAWRPVQFGEKGNARVLILTAANTHLVTNGVVNVDSIAELAQSAFDNADPTVRGAAWWLIAHKWKTDEESHATVAFFSGLLTSRFGIHPHFEGLDAMTRLWLDGVVSGTDAAQRKRFRVRWTPIFGRRSRLFKV